MPEQDPAVPVVFENGLWKVQKPCIMQFEGILMPGENLRVRVQDVVAKCVLVPEALLQIAPWSYDGGSEHVAYYLGYKSVEDMFAHMAQAV